MMVFAHFVPKETQVRLQERQTTGQAATYVSSGFTSPALAHRYCHLGVTGAHLNNYYNAGLLSWWNLRIILFILLLISLSFFKLCVVYTQKSLSFLLLFHILPIFIICLLYSLHYPFTYVALYFMYS